MWFALAKIAFTGVLAADLRAGAKIAIVGAGSVGQMFTRWAAASTLADIIVIDKNKVRLDLATLGGAKVVILGDHRLPLRRSGSLPTSSCEASASDSHTWEQPSWDGDHEISRLFFHLVSK